MSPTLFPGIAIFSFQKIKFMKKLTTPILYLLFIAAILVGCKDDEGKSSKTDLLTAKSWHITKWEATFQGNTEDVTDEFSDGPCDNDDSSKFHKDGKYEEKTGAQKCDVDDEDSTGTWAWKDNETKITINIDGDVTDATLVSLTSSTLKVSLTGGDLAPGVTLTITFSAI
jgi:hypothetical protein